MQNNISLFLGTGLIYLVIFILPIFIYLRVKLKVKPLTYLRLKGNVRKGILSGVLVSILFIILLIVKNAIVGWKSINFNIGLLWISVIFVGIFEEIPFRGFLLQQLRKYMSFWSANIITSIVFVIFHFPTWIISHVNIVSASIPILMGSLAFGYLFEEYKSLWSPIICHSVFDLCTWIGLA